MSDLSGPLVLDNSDLLVCVDVSDSCGFDASEDRALVPTGLDIEGAGWLGYYREQFMPTVVRQGIRLRKDPWQRIPGPVGWRRW